MSPHLFSGQVEVGAERSRVIRGTVELNHDTQVKGSVHCPLEVRIPVTFTNSLLLVTRDRGIRYWVFVTLIVTGSDGSFCSDQ